MEAWRNLSNQPDAAGIGVSLFPLGMVDFAPGMARIACFVLCQHAGDARQGIWFGAINRGSGMG
jgi:hypothetical protein